MTRTLALALACSRRTRRRPGRQVTRCCRRQHHRRSRSREDAGHDAGDREGARGGAAVRQHHRVQHVPARAEADAGAGQRALSPACFVHINLNTATAAEIMLMPGAGKRMAHEFEEYRPWQVVRAVRQGDRQVRRREGSRAARAVHVHPAQPQHGHRSRLHDHPRRRQAHGPRVRRVPAVEDAGAVREGDRQVRRRQGSEAPVALRLHSAVSSRCAAVDGRASRGHDCRWRAQAPPPPFELPAPTGKSPVGTTRWVVVDPSRAGNLRARASNAKSK